MNTKMGVVYKIASRASDIGVTRFRMPRNVYSWMYGFAHLSRYSKGRINIEFPEDAEEVEKQLRGLGAFFLACRTTAFSIKFNIEKLIRENRYDLLPEITGDPQSKVYNNSLRTIAQTDAYGGEAGWDVFDSVTELVKFLSVKAKENGFYFFWQLAGCRDTPNEDDPKLEDEISRPWEDWDFEKIVKKEMSDLPDPSTDDFKVVTTKRMIAFYADRIEKASFEDKEDTIVDSYYDALLDHEFMWKRLKAVSHLEGLSDSIKSLGDRFETTLKIYRNMLASKYVRPEEKYAVRFEMDSFIKDEHFAESASRQIKGEFSLDDLKKDITDSLRLDYDTRLEKLRFDMKKEYEEEYRRQFPEDVKSEVTKLRPDLFKEPEKPAPKPYRVYRSESYSYMRQLQGEFDTREEALEYAAELNRIMDEMASDYSFDMRDYRSAYVEGPEDKK